MTGCRTQVPYFEASAPVMNGNTALKCPTRTDTRCPSVRSGTSLGIVSIGRLDIPELSCSSYEFATYAPADPTLATSPTARMGGDTIRNQGG